MHLISPLAAGIAGAPGGTAAIYNRGTATRATVYSDWDGRTVLSTNSDIVLDVNGGVACYVNTPVTVTVRSATGTIVRTWTEAVSADVVEYRGASFTGVDQQTLATGRGSNYPVSVDTILDRWATSASAYDFHVDINGTDIDLQDIPVIPYYSVVEYGAVGDGTTDDTVAVNAAIAAANTAGGGIVWFPAGTYRITSTIVWYRGINLLGVGSNRSTIKYDAATGYALTITASGGAGTRVYGASSLKVYSAQSTIGGFAIPSVANDDTVVFRDMYIDCGLMYYGYRSSAAIGYVGKTLFIACNILSASPYETISSTYHSGGEIHLYGCYIYRDSASGPDAVVELLKGSIVSSRFELSGSSAGTIIATYNGIYSARGIAIHGNKFEGGSSIQHAIDAGTLDSTTDLHESDNSFSTLTPYSFTLTETLIPTGIDFGSRRGKEYRYSSPATPLTVDATLGELIYIDHTVAGSITLDIPVLPAGAHLILLMTNHSGGARDFITSGTQVHDSPTTVDAGTPTWTVNDHESCIVHFVSTVFYRNGVATVTRWNILASNT